MFVLISFIAFVNGCTLSRDNKHFREFELMKHYNITDRLRPVNLTSCETIGIRYAHERIDNFNCSSDACKKWCLHNPNCYGTLYKKQVCIRASYLQISDKEPKNLYDGFQAFYKGQINYFGNKCARVPKDQCELVPNCFWNKGRKSYADEIYGGSQGGFCGYVC